MAMRVAQSNGAPGVRYAMAAKDFDRKALISAYVSIKAVLNPVIGNVEVTRFGWRHMFRKARSTASKKSSALVIPYLSKVLSVMPSVIAMTSVEYIENDGFEHRICEYLMKYNKTKITDSSGIQRIVSTHIRVVEEIAYPKKWEASAMLSQLVQRRVVLKSAYFKDLV